MPSKLSGEWIFFIISLVALGATILTLILVPEPNAPQPPEPTCKDNEYGTYPDCLPCLPENCINDLSCCQEGLYCSSQGECVSCLPDGDKGCPERPCCQGLLCSSEGTCVSALPVGDGCQNDEECEEGSRCLDDVCTACHNRPGQGCSFSSECCPPFECQVNSRQCWIPLEKGPCETGQCAAPAVCGPNDTCCFPSYQGCSKDSECCGEMTCEGGRCCLKAGLECQSEDCCAPNQCLGGICQAPITYRQKISFHDPNNPSLQVYTSGANVRFGVPTEKSVKTFEIWYLYDHNTTSIISANENLPILVFIYMGGGNPYVWAVDDNGFVRSSPNGDATWNLESLEQHLYDGGRVAFKLASSGKYLVPTYNEFDNTTLSDDLFYFEVHIA